MEQPFTVGQVAHMQFNVRDIKKSIAFYRMFDPRAGEDPDRVRVALGPQTRLILKPDPGLGEQRDANLNHFAVVLEGAKDVEGVLTFMRAHGSTNVGLVKATTLLERGLRCSVILRIAPPFPEASLPSKITQTRFLFLITHF